jgi:hypothetical protein
MTPKISLVTAVGAVALLLAATPAPAQSPDVVDRAVAARQATLQHSGRDLVFDNHRFRGRTSEATSPTAYPDVVDRAVAARQSTGRDLVFDSYRDDPQPTIQPVRVLSDTGREIEWPQIGIGFGGGILLALGLMLALRAARIRPLAH